MDSEFEEFKISLDKENEFMQILNAMKFNMDRIKRESHEILEALRSSSDQNEILKLQAKSDSFKEEFKTAYTTYNEHVKFSGMEGIEFTPGKE